MTLQAELRNIAAQFNADSGTLHVVGKDGSLALAASFGILPSLMPTIRSIPIGKGIAGAAAQRREPVSICNLQTDASGVARPGAKATGMEGAIAVPILDGERLVGVLGIGKVGAHAYSDDEIQALSRLAHQLLPLVRCAE
jgi:signal transduction protein with GAF and PtsI domain